MARRGIFPVCDQQRHNFVGTEREFGEALKDMDQEKIENELTARGIGWIFSPCAVPRFGGACEGLVMSVKRALKFMLGNVLTVDDVFHTVIPEM